MRGAKWVLEVCTLGFSTFHTILTMNELIIGAHSSINSGGDGGDVKMEMIDGTYSIFLLHFV
jgi:hypothetical protein